MKSTLTNEQLIAKSKQWVKELCESGGRKWCLRVPADHNQDPDLIFSELCNRLEEYAQQSQPSGMRCEPEFIEYINKSRAAFVKHIYGMEWDLKLRTAVDDLLICFDQMKNRLSEPSPAGASEEELKVTEALLNERQRVLDAIPECPDHGRNCVPHAIEWVEKAKLSLANNTASEGMAEALYTYQDMMNVAGWMAAADNKRPIHELKEEAEMYISKIKPFASLSPGVEDNQTKKQ